MYTCYKQAIESNKKATIVAANVLVEISLAIGALADQAVKNATNKQERVKSLKPHVSCQGELDKNTVEGLMGFWSLCKVTVQSYARQACAA